MKKQQSEHSDFHCTVFIGDFHCTILVWLLSLWIGVAIVFYVLYCFLLRQIACGNAPRPNELAYSLFCNSSVLIFLYGNADILIMSVFLVCTIFF